MWRRAGRAAVAAAACLSAASSAHPPYGLVADKSGSVYFSDLETVWRLSADGRLSVFRPEVPETHVHELALAADGAIEGDQNRYDPATGRFTSGLWRRMPDGRERFALAMADRPPPGFGVWQDRGGNRYASHWPSNDDRRTMLSRRGADGRSQLVFAQGRPVPRQASVGSLGGMAFPADGSVYFADRNLLRRLAPDGSTRLVYRGPAESSLRGIAIAADGRLLATDSGTKALLSIDESGRAETLYRESGAWTPTAIASAGGRLLMLEANADPRDYVDRVRLVELRDGSARVIAEPGAPAQATAPRTMPGSEARLAAWLKATAALAIAAILGAAGAWLWRRWSRSPRSRSAPR